MAVINKPQIIPAILKPTFSEFAYEAKTLSKISNLIQIDVMDGLFVPEKSFTNLAKINELNLDNSWELHLMVKHPLRAIKKSAGIKNLKRVIFHIESSDDPEKIIATIRAQKLSVGIAINPDTPIKTITPYLKKIDLVLFMTVIPGKQGQKFINKIGVKVKKLKTIAPPKLLLAVDGGINQTTILKASGWGVTVFDVGSILAKAQDPKAVYNQLKQTLKK